MAKGRKTYYRKLVRDRIPEICEKDGHDVITKTLTVKQYIVELKRKIVEEAGELKKTKNKKETIEELADIMECIDAIAEHLGIPHYALERMQREKRAQRGGFKKKIYLLATVRK